MALVDELSASIADAMRQHDPVRLSTLRMLKAALMNREVERKRGLDEAESLQVVVQLVKQRTETEARVEEQGRKKMGKEKK